MNYEKMTKKQLQKQMKELEEALKTKTQAKEQQKQQKLEEERKKQAIAYNEKLDKIFDLVLKVFPKDPTDSHSYEEKVHACREPYAKESFLNRNGLEISFGLNSNSVYFSAKYTTYEFYLDTGYDRQNGCSHNILERVLNYDNFEEELKQFKEDAKKKFHDFLDNIKMETFK